MIILHIISWLAFLCAIPVSVAILFIKNRSAVSCWIRIVQHPERWLLSATIPKDSTPKQISSMLQQVVTQARNSEWDASCTYKCRDHSTGEWIIGLISNGPPAEKETPEGFLFTHLPPTQVIRVSGKPSDEDVTIKSELENWATKKDIPHSQVACSLSAQSFQCWEWEVTGPTSSPPSSTITFISRLTEGIFEIRDILLYPILFTAISIIMCGTGSPWLFGIGIFMVILMSGACKFVFMHQREDITQESHLQNY